eukprot:3612599-Rhodomonas_salina.2
MDGVPSVGGVGDRRMLHCSSPLLARKRAVLCHAAWAASRGLCRSRMAYGSEQSTWHGVVRCHHHDDGRHFRGLGTLCARLVLNRTAAPTARAKDAAPRSSARHEEAVWAHRRRNGRGRAPAVPAVGAADASGQGARRAEPRALPA